VALVVGAGAILTTTVVLPTILVGWDVPDRFTLMRRSQRMNNCARSGFLVDATSPLTVDPTDLQVEGLPVVGCSRVRCGRCGALVRNAPGLAFRTRDDVAAPQLAALYATPDLTSSALLHQTRPEWRLYLCKCARWLETWRHACAEPDPDDWDPDMPWRCEGHPLISLPHDLDGVVVASKDELRELAVRGFHDVAPPRVRPADKVRGEWLARLYVRLSPGEAEVVAAVALASVEDPGPRTRALALRFLYHLPIDRGRARLLALIDGERSLFAGVADEVTTISVDKTLEHTIWRILAPLVGSEGRARDLARAEALAGTASVAIYDALARHDSGWVTSHGVELARAASDRIEELFDSFSQFPQGVPIRALRQRIQHELSTA
jgi:hypothetical protein